MRDEDGAEMLEFTLVLPLAVFMVFATLQLALMGYSVIALTAASERAAWEVPLEALSSSGGQSAEDAVKQAILDCSFGIDASSLEVSGVSYEAQSRTKSEPVAANKVISSADGKDKFRIRELSGEQVAGDLSYTVSYTLPSFFADFPGLGGVKVAKKVTRLRVQSSRTEIR